MHKLSMKIAYGFLVAFVLSNFDENQQYLDLDNNQGLLRFEQRAMKLCMVLVWIVNCVRRIW